jgi:hypothetical protein
MNTNVGIPDRLIRIVIGLGLLSLIFVLQGPSRWLGLIGAVPLLRALVGFCPLYTLLGISGSSPTARRV